MTVLNRFKEVWMCDTEFYGGDGEHPVPVCLVAEEYNSGKVIKLWQDELNQLDKAPFDVEDSVMVAYLASAELGCFKALGWAMPRNIIDLYAEFRNMTNGKELEHGVNLLGAMAYFGLNGIEHIEKKTMRDLILRGGPWDDEEKKGIIDYCATDVTALRQLIGKMADNCDIFSIIRGRYMKAVTEMEWAGVCLDTEMLTKLINHWADVKRDLIDKANAHYGVYKDGIFSFELFEKYLADKGYQWPRTAKGRLDTKEDTFKERCKLYPDLNLLREVRSTSSKLRLFELAVGKDGRNRTLLSPFKSKTGRNQPSNKKFVFGPSVWLRFLIKPAPGYAICYVDYAQQEFGIAGALSGDERMKEAYLSGDPYLAFAKQAGAVPESATKKSHPIHREQFKACVLAVQYGMGARALALRINQPVEKAKELLNLHKQTYKVYWQWMKRFMDSARLEGYIRTPCGWNMWVDGKTDDRTIQNWPMQSTGADILRLACIKLVNAGVTVSAPIHDAVLIEADVKDIHTVVEQAQKIMTDASSQILKGFGLATDAKIITHPNRFDDERGVEMWEMIQELVKKYG